MNHTLQKSIHKIINQKPLKRAGQNPGYYTLPINFSSLIEKGDHVKCGLKESIMHYIHLITTTYLGECRFDASFGCSIWEYDFDNSMSDLNLRENLGRSLDHALGKNEKRLTDIEVHIEITQSDISLEQTAKRLKKRVDIKINATLKKTNEHFMYSEYFFLGPLSYN